MAEAALKVSLVYCIIQFLDPILLSWQAVNRPIVVAPLAGLVLGDFQTGIIMGASLESIFMGISAIGGSIPSDATTASIIAVAFVVLTGGNMEAGLALSLPIGTAMASIQAMMMPLWSSLSAYWENLAINSTPRKFNIQVLTVAIVQIIIMAIILFLSVAYGVEGLNNFLASLPAWVMTGLNASSGMMLAVGFAILTSMIWSGSLGIFFFLGYILVKYLNLGTLPIAFIGAVFAFVIFFQEKKAVDLKNSLTKSNGTNNLVDSEEDFF